MKQNSFKHQPIYIGYPWSLVLRISASEPVFPESCQLKTDIRRATGAPLLATLSTESGGLTRLDDERIEISISPEQSARMREGSVQMDLVRTDVQPSKHLGIFIKVRVELPVTMNAL